MRLPVADWLPLIEQYVASPNAGAFNMLTLDLVIEELHSQFGGVDAPQIHKLCREKDTKVPCVIKQVDNPPNDM